MQSGSPGWQAWATLSVVAAVLVVLATTRVRAYVVLLGALAVLLGLGVVEDDDLLQSVANPGMVTVAILFAVGAGMRDTGGMSWLAGRLLGRPKQLMAAQARLVSLVSVLSAFMNNIPLVAVMLPVVSEWSRRIRVSPSRLMIPLSFASILGGTCTLIGTSTTLVVNGLISTELGPNRVLRMFDITYVGLPCAILGLVYLVLTSRWLIIDRQPAISVRDDPREYTIEMIVGSGGSLVNKTIEAAGLRHLPGLFLMEIHRGTEVLATVAPHTVLKADDQLVFVGVVSSMVDLQKMRGLVPAANQVFKLDANRPARCLVEVVVSNTNPLVGTTIREARFRTHYDAAVIAAARNGERINRKLGDVKLRPGDTLLIEAGPGFVETHRDSKDFYLVSEIADSTPPRHDRAWVAICIFATMVTVVALGWLSMLTAGLLAAGAMVVTRCMTSRSALGSIDWAVLLVIVAAFGVGRAMAKSGAASLVAESLLSIYGDDAHSTLAVVCAVTMAFTNVMNANAAAVLVFPIAMQAAERLHVDPFPLAIGIIMGAACSFATPIGYQTNLMVYGPGGYRFWDFVRIGGPLSLMILSFSVFWIPMIWPF